MESHCFLAIQRWSCVKLGWCPPPLKGRLSWHLSTGGPRTQRDTDAPRASSSFRMPYGSAPLTCGLPPSLPCAGRFSFCTSNPSLNAAAILAPSVLWNAEEGVEIIPLLAHPGSSPSAPQTPEGRASTSQPSHTPRELPLSTSQPVRGGKGAPGQAVWERKDEGRGPWGGQSEG